MQKSTFFQKKYSMLGGKFVISGGKVETGQHSTIVSIETDEGPLSKASPDEMKVGGDFATDAAQVHASMEVLGKADKIIFDFLKWSEADVMAGNRLLTRKAMSKPYCR